MCTLEKRGRVYVLTLTGATEHRLNPTLVDSITDAVHLVRSGVGSIAGSPGRGHALVMAAEGNFFSNGGDLAYLKPAPFARIPVLDSSLRLALSSLFSLPVPTVAAVCGHAAGTGLVLALAHDYVVMRSDRGFLYLSELDAGFPILAKYFSAIVREKVTDPRAFRDVMLAGKRVMAERGVEMGMVDLAVVGAEETVEAAVKMAEELAWRTRDYATSVEKMRMVAFPATCRELGVEEGEVEEKERMVRVMNSKL